MGVTVTETRPVTGNQYIQNWTNGTLTSNFELQQRLAPSYGGATQTTTSYRTGRRLPSDAHAEETALLSSATYGEVRNRLYREALRDRRSRWDTGHPFDTIRKYITCSYWHEGVETVGTNRYQYSGPVVPLPGTGNKFPVIPSFNDAFYGAAAIARTKPTDSYASLLQTLVELRREGLPALVGMAGNGSYSQVGSEYLNWEFGFEPLAKDFANAAYAVTESERILEQFKRGSGVKIRRAYVFPEERTTTVGPITNGQAVAADASPYRPWTSTSGTRLSLVSGKLHDSTVTLRRIYFKGAFMYHTPLSLQSAGRLQKAAAAANHLLGIELTPETLYNLAPWTWLADWNANIGDIIDNVTAFTDDGLVLQYGYLMCEDIATRSFVFVKTQSTKRGPEGPFAIEFTTHRKRRLRAYPFGFALNPSAFTSRQWAILGSLGLTKGPTSLP